MKGNKMNLEQHFLNLKDGKLEKVILKELSGRDFNTIIELGAGKGDFTKTFMRSNNHILAYEIDSSLREEFLKNTTSGNFIVKDIRDNIPMEKGDIIIAAPPYGLLEFIKDEYVDKFKMPYILMVSERHLGLFEKSKVIYELSGKDFLPESRGKHYIITNLG